MADVQKENGYTPIANDILDHLVKLPLSGAQLRIIIVIWRFTYGFSRKDHELSEAFLVKATGLSKKTISNELKRLIDLNLIKIVKASTFTTAKVITFNKDFDTWNSRTILPQGNNPSTVEEKYNSTVEQSFHSTGEQSFPQDKQIYKTNIKTKSIDDFFEMIWSKYPRKEGKGSISKTQKKKLYKIGSEEMLRCIDRYKEKIEAEGIENRFIKQGSTFFNSGYVDFLDANYIKLEGRDGESCGNNRQGAPKRKLSAAVDA